MKNVKLCTHTIFVYLLRNKTPEPCISSCLWVDVTRHRRLSKLAQLEHLCSEKTPTCPKIHIGSQVITRQSQSYKSKKMRKIQIFKFWIKKRKKKEKKYACKTFSEVVWQNRCVTMKWIQQVLGKIQSGHDSVHRQMDGQTDGLTDGKTDDVKSVYPPFNFIEAGGITATKQFTTPVDTLSSKPLRQRTSSFSDWEPQCSIA